MADEEVGAESLEEKEDLSKIVAELRQKMAEIDNLTKEFDLKKKELEKSPPQKTQKILEEIKVPPLELLR